MKRKTTSEDQFQEMAQPSSGDQVQDGENAQAIAAAEAVAGNPGEHRAEDGSDDRDGNGDA